MVTRTFARGLFVACAALAAALPSCGLIPSDEELTPIPSDGIGNFGDSAPVELCLGTARVVAPAAATSASAVCVREDAEARACEGDEACDGIERCICGRCIVEACQGADACGEGKICRNKRCTVACTLDAECPADERCTSGGCARACSSDGACHHGERCDPLDSVCVAQICSEAIACGAGERCEAEAVIGELREPEVTVIDGVAVAFVEIRSGGSSAIYRAKIDSDRRWTADPIDPVLAPEDGVPVGAPSILADGGALELFFAVGDGEAIGHAVSTDGGFTFARDPALLLAAAEPWEKGWIGSPAAVRFGGATYLFYEAGPRAGIGQARVDPNGAVRLGTGLLVTPTTLEDPLAWRGVTEVGAPYALVAGGGLRLYVTGRGAEGSDAIVGDAAAPADRNDSIGLITSFDGVHFDRYPNGPVFARLANLRAYLGEREAAVRLLPAGGAEITFVASDDSGESISGLARAAH